MNVPSSLPNEIWIRVLQNLDRNDDDLSFLWITCRHVCSVFRDATESTFREKLLPKLRITFMLGDCYPPTRDDRRLSSVPLVCEFEFERLADDQQTAILSLGEELPDEIKPMARKRLRDLVAEAHPEIPHHAIQIRRDINDGPISDLAFDYDKFEVSCNWKDLFSAFYGEEHLYHQLLGKAVAEREPWLETLKANVDRKEMDPEQVIMKALDGFAEDNTTARKLARRARVKKQFELLDGTEWDFVRDGDAAEEKRILKNLQQLRQFTSFEEWSDDEDEEEDENGEEDNRDGWETEDEEEEYEGSAEADE